VLIHGGGSIDGGRSWSDGRQILGNHKTIIGFLAGVAVGTAIALLQGNIIQGFLFSLGAVFGDLVFAFIKRRLGHPPGAPWPIGDQIGFVIFAILFGSLVEPRPDLLQDLTLLLTTIPVHYLSNLFAWGLKWKKNPW